MTDLADALVRETGVDFRQSHEIIAQVVETAIRAGRTADRIDLAMNQTAARARLGHPLPLSAATVRDALDPTKGVARRNGVGGPAPASVMAMIASTRAEVGDQQARLAMRRARLASAATALDKAVAQALAAGEPR